MPQFVVNPSTSICDGYLIHIQRIRTLSAEESYSMHEPLGITRWEQAQAAGGLELRTRQHCILSPLGCENDKAREGINIGSVVVLGST